MIAENVASYMKNKGIKQNAVAKSIGISNVAMSETLAGRRTMTADEYVGICDFLEVPYSKFTKPEA